jgi:endonuclease YncB( thermonuclease family)
MASLSLEITRLADRLRGLFVQACVQAWQWLSKRRIEDVLLVVLVVVIAALLLTHGLRSSPSVAFEAVPPGSVQVTDGNTIRHKRSTVRLVGFNAPETGRRASCQAERTLARQATRRLNQLVRGGSRLEFAFVACACPRGTEGTQQCNFGTRCGILKVNGRDVGAILIEERLAVPFRCGATSCPPTPRPWC